MEHLHQDGQLTGERLIETFRWTNRKLGGLYDNPTTQRGTVAVKTLKQLCSEVKRRKAKELKSTKIKDTWEDEYYDEFGKFLDKHPITGGRAR